MITLSSCNYIYDPTTTPRDRTKFVIYFETKDCILSQQKRAHNVVEHLDSLKVDAERLLDESARFFKWSILHNVSTCNLEYSRILLSFFHSKGLLLGKSTVDNPIKQLKHRYLVVFSMGKHVFAKRYNSIRELKVDTGKRPSQIQRHKTDLVCHNLLVS